MDTISNLRKAKSLFTLDPPKSVYAYRRRCGYPHPRVISFIFLNVFCFPRMKRGSFTCVKADCVP